ncbi:MULTISPECIES: PadR family transcriptional regulator [unclassified Crossiella]|uniref:PadR family transcriptional regulator n=1 Tax=unclassified Crossiella TaxID=2620835 RepID=UPI001FFFEF70|nr:MULTISPECIES: PadR family transcriptional regulator [unclassified Crossiella]MCK2241095.1 PadR family transcriptional regulator [Crossiella sp. S99.2]MCK2253761.1 PadR family transcriptional regulator [Crossiella sp. S99.1]
MATPIRRSPLALTVLCLMIEAPVHAYRIQQLIKERGKDRVVNVRQRASVYQTIERLLKAGLIKVKETERADNRPERTIYEIGQEGLATARAWLREMFTATGTEFPEFPAAVAFMPLLEPGEIRALLEVRATKLAELVAETDTVTAEALAAGVPRLFLLEEEYQRATLIAQLDWVRATVAELGDGRITWDQEWLRAVGDSLSTPTDEGESS